MQINNSSSINFNGYKNLMTTSARVSKNEAFTFLSMQLDNFGKNDLEIWKNLQQNLFSVKNPSDVFTTELFEGFGKLNLYLGDKSIDPNKYKNSNKNKFIMEAYTWMADLMKRIMNENHPVKDSGAFKVFNETVENILPLLENKQKLANDFVLLSQNPKNHPQETAGLIKESINKIMLDYFSKA